MIDTNADGLVSKAEFDKWYGTFKNHSGGGKSHALFASYDANGDGRLTVAEFVPLAFALTRQPLKEEERFFNVIVLGFYSTCNGMKERENEPVICIRITKLDSFRLLY